MDHPNQSGTLAKGSDLAPAEYDAPDNSWESRAIRQASIVMTLPRKDVQRLVRPALPQLGPRGVKHTATPTVEDVFAESSRTYPDNKAFFSGGPAGYSGTPRNAWGSDFG